jgi:hypothetical protein
MPQPADGCLLLYSLLLVPYSQSPYRPSAHLPDTSELLQFPKLLTLPGMYVTIPRVQAAKKTNIPVEVGERALSRRRRRRCKFARLPNLANDTLRQMDRSPTDLWRVGCVPHRRSNPQTRCYHMRGANLSGSEQSDGRLITRARFLHPGCMQDRSIGGRSTHTHEYSSQDLLMTPLKKKRFAAARPLARVGSQDGLTGGPGSTRSPQRYHMIFSLAFRQDRLRSQRSPWPAGASQGGPR